MIQATRKTVETNLASPHPCVSSTQTDESRGADFVLKPASSLDQRDQCTFKQLSRHHRKSCVLKDNRTNHTRVRWGIVICRWLAFRRIKYSWKIKISPIIFLMYMRLWAQCPLCSHNRQALFSIHTLVCTRTAQVTSGVLSPSLRMVEPACRPGCLVRTNEVTLRTWPRPFISLDTWSAGRDPRPLTNGPKPSLNPGC